MFEETEFVINSISARLRACKRQCRQLRLKIDNLGGCPCDVLAECPFNPGDDRVWFPDKLKYYQDLASE